MSFTSSQSFRSSSFSAWRRLTSFSSSLTYACLRARDRAADSRFFILRSRRRSPPPPTTTAACSCSSARRSTSCSSAWRGGNKGPRAAAGQRQAAAPASSLAPPPPQPAPPPRTSCSSPRCGSIAGWLLLRVGYSLLVSWSCLAAPLLRKGYDGACCAATARSVFK